MKTLIHAATAILSMIVSSAQATVYDVNRCFTDGSSSASLTGTLDIPVGSYTLQNSGPSPFTAVNLTLTVNGTPYHLTHALTGFIDGTGQFLIDATPTTLTFNTANANGSNPADLDFSDNTVLSANNLYAIGFDGYPGFEIALTDVGNPLADVTFPIVFGNFVPVPEPGTLSLFAVALSAGLFWRGRRHWSRHET